MRTLTVNLNSIEKVKNFTNAASCITGDVDLTSDKYLINGKSIMGIFSLDLSKDITVTFGEDVTDVEIDTFVKKIDTMIVK